MKKEKILKISFFSTFILIIIYAVITYFRANAVPYFWGDECASLFVANHFPFSKAFLSAVNAQIAGMPWHFFEYAFYIRFLKYFIPFKFLMNHLEMFLRLPLTYYFVIWVVSAFLLIKRLSKSYLISSVITLTVFMTSHLSSLLSSELRFHSAAFAYTIVSLCFFSYMITGSRKAIYGWLISSLMAGWTHAYSLYYVFFQMGMLFFISLNMIPGLSIDKKNKKPIIYSILIISFNVILQLAFFFYKLNTPFQNQIRTTSQALKFSLDIISTHILVPNIFIWLVLFFLFVIIAFANQKQNKTKLIIPFIIGLSQFIFLIFVMTYFTRFSYPGYARYSRFGYPGMISFIFILSYFSKFFFKYIQKIELYITPFILILLTIIIPPKSFWGNPNPWHGNPPKDKWDRIKDQILKFNAYGKVKAVIGLTPSGDHSLQGLGGSMIQHSWQTYVKGPFSISHITGYWTNKYGGLDGYPCKERNNFEIAKDGNHKSFIVDFCDKTNFFLRVYDKK